MVVLVDELDMLVGDLPHVLYVLLALDHSVDGVSFSSVT